MMYEATAHQETQIESRSRTFHHPSFVNSIRTRMLRTETTNKNITNTLLFSLRSFVLRSITKTNAKTGPKLTDLQLMSEVNMAWEQGLLPCSGDRPDNILRSSIPARRQGWVGQDIYAGYIGQNSEGPCRQVDIEDRVLSRDDWDGDRR